MRSSNPSIGLNIWGPLIPANDCKPCMLSLASLQLVGGALLWKLPGRNPLRSKGANMSLRIGGAILGTYLGIGSAVEMTRQFVSYDAWIDDAKRARIQEDKVRKQNQSLFSLAELRYKWFGPKNYVPVSWESYKNRTLDYLKRIERSRPAMDTLSKIHTKMAKVNEGIADDVLERLSTGELKLRGPIASEVEDLKALPFSEEEDQLIYDGIDMRNYDFWEAFDSFNVPFICFLPSSASYLTPGVEIDGELKYHVNYMPLAQNIPKK